MNDDDHNTGTSHAIFIGNLDGKLKKGPMRRLLHALCTPHGHILDIVVKRVPDRLRGTAFVVYTDRVAVQAAVLSLQGMTVLGRRIRVEEARGESRAYKEYAVWALGVDADGSDGGGSTAYTRTASSGAVHKIDPPQDDMDVE